MWYVLRVYIPPNSDCNEVPSDTGVRYWNRKSSFGEIKKYKHVTPFYHMVMTGKSYKTHIYLASHV